MQFHRRKFLKGMGIAVLTACGADASFRFFQTLFSTVLHVGRAANNLLGLSPEHHGVLLQKTETTGQLTARGAELWVVDGDQLLMPKGTGTKYPYIIRSVAQQLANMYALMGYEAGLVWRELVPHARKKDWEAIHRENVTGWQNPFLCI